MQPKATEEISDKIIAMPVSSDFFPYKFRNGSVVDGLSLTCGGCGAEVNMPHIRVNITKYEHVIAVEAWCTCYGCLTLTPSQIRMDDEGGYLADNGKGGWNRGSYLPYKFGWLNRFKAIFNKIVASWR